MKSSAIVFDSQEVAALAGWLKRRFVCVAVDRLDQFFRRVPAGFVPAPAVDDWVQTARIWAITHVFHTQGRILDIGTGDGWPAIPLAIRGRTVTGVDPAENRLATAAFLANEQEARLARFEPMYGEDLRYYDHSYEGVVVAKTLEYCRNPFQVLRESTRVLHRGGRLVIVPRLSGERSGGPSGLETSIMRLGETGWQLNLWFHRAEDGAEELLTLRFAEDVPILFEKKRVSLRGLLQTKRGNPLIVKQCLKQVEPTQVAAEISAISRFPLFQIVEMLQELGYVRLKVVRDPGALVKSFLHEQRLQEPGHPFVAPGAFEAICSGIGSMALQTEIGPGSEDGMIVAEKSADY
jgi:SAM-dependent methyltransferase